MARVRSAAATFTRAARTQAAASQGVNSCGSTVRQESMRRAKKHGPRAFCTAPPPSCASPALPGGAPPPAKPALPSVRGGRSISRQRHVIAPPTAAAACRERRRCSGEAARAEQARSPPGQASGAARLCGVRLRVCELLLEALEARHVNPLLGREGAPGDGPLLLGLEGGLEPRALDEEVLRRPVSGRAWVTTPPAALEGGDCGWRACTFASASARSSSSSL